MMRLHSVCVVVVIAAAVVADSCAGDRVEFSRDVRPILSAKCFECHGPDEQSRKAELRLDVADTRDGPFREQDEAIIKPGDVDASALWSRVTTTDNDLLMPPAESHKERLSDRELEIIRQWIQQGAEYEPFWAFVPPKPQEAPTVADAAWNSNRIDRFVRSRLEQQGRTPKTPADKRTLIRRVTFDLTGLPPTPEEIAAFLQDDSDTAYQAVVDRLLSSLHYGEHMARYWLDVVRFADTNGIHHDHYREMTPYRDWVIRSFNDNLRFDAFVRYQLAGDLYEQPTIDQQIASGFNRLHLVIDAGTALPEESFTRNVVDRVTSVGTAFLGLTVGCAACHDHKYDPITQRDFYQLYAFFNNIDATPETPGRSIHPPFIQLPNEEQERQLREFDAKIAAANEDLVTQQTQQKQVDTDAASTDEAKTTAAAKVESAEQHLKSLQQQKAGLENTIPVSLVMKERTEVRPTHILVRGAYDQSGEPVERNTPGFLPPLRSTGPVKTRMDLANWLTDRSHPLTARVTVNRFWQQFFGVGLVKTSEDFGAQGEWPSHPALLDDLTVNFVESGWDVRQLIRTIVTSRTYQQSSVASREEYLEDPDNRMLARGSRFRLDAEVIRDQILAISGLLNREMYGRSVKPPQPPDLWKSVSMVSSSTYSFEPDSGDKIYRRSVYSFWKRALPPPQMTIFDAPTREACIARRERTNTPLQALVLMNEPQYFKAAQRFAKDVLVRRGSSDVTDLLRYAYESVTSCVADDEELADLANAVEQFRAVYIADPKAAQAVTAEAGDITDAERVELAAWTMLVNSLFNLDITKTRN
jgi:hypothetical protein